MRLLFSLLTFLSVAATAMESENAQNALMLEAVSYRVVTEFNVHLMQKDASSEDTLEQVLIQGDQLSSTLVDVSAPLVSSWKKYRDFSWDKHTQADGDTYTFNDMRILHRDFLKLMAGVKQQLNADLLPAEVARKTNALLLIEQLSAEYLEISAATFGIFGFAGSEEAIQIEARSQAFERTINELKKIHADNPQTLKKVKKLALRWKFIKSTLLAYNERSAPFAVAKTVGFIRKQIIEI